MKKFRTTHKKVLSLLLVMIMLVSIAPMNMFSVTASAVSGSEIVAYARQFLGCQYVYGTAGPNTFDCSGFTKYVFGHFGISLPHSTYTLWNNSTSYGTVVATGSTANAKAGDLILWEGHVAIYTENGYCVEALNENYDVTDKVAVNSHTNGMNYKVIRVYGVSDATTVPGKPSIDINKYVVNKDENFTVNFSAEHAERYWIGLYLNNVLITDATTYNNEITMYLSQEGKYSVVVTAINSLGETAGYSSIVVGDPTPYLPYKPNISINKKVLDLGEPFIVNYKSENADRFWIGIYKDGKLIVNVNPTGGQYQTSFDSYGEYRVFVTAINNFGETYSNVTVTVGSFNITYNPNGGKNAPANQTQKYNEAITLSTQEPTRDGYKFLGWSTVDNAINPMLLPGQSYGPNKDITLYAVWEKAVNEYTIKGALKTFGNSDDEILVDFYKPGESESCGYTIFRGDAEEFCIGGIQQGEYIIKISKPNHVTREYSVVVDKDIELDIQLNLIGDVDGNGKVNITDYNAILRHVKKTGALDGYAFDCADVDGNSRIMVTDYNAVLRHVKKTETLW